MENPPTWHARSLVRSPQRPWLIVRYKISLLSRFGGWVLDVRIVLNSYFSITLKKKDWSFYWYFLWECPWSKNSTKSVIHISNNFIQDFCLSKAAIMDMERKFSNSTFDWYRFHHGWTSVRPTLRVWKLFSTEFFLLRLDQKHTRNPSMKIAKTRQT